MILNILSFILGISSLFLLKHLPPIFLDMLALLLTGALYYLGPLKLKRLMCIILCFCMGICWADFRFTLFFWKSLPTEIFDRSISVRGQIISLPQYIFQGQRLLVFTSTIGNSPVHARILLSCYQACFNFHVGEIWSWQAKLIRPHGTHNPGEFNYETWLFSQGIQAKGYIISSPMNHLIELHKRNVWFDSLREKIQNQISHIIKDPNELAVLTALAVGSRSMMNEELWDILQNTGTNHLIAIAGLHIGFATFFIYFFAKWIWRITYPLSRFCTAQKFSQLMALLGAIFYSLLAGMSIPTERTIWMFSLFIVAIFLYRSIGLINRLCLAVCMILFLDPSAIVSESFWLSFLAMASMGYGLGRQSNCQQHLIYRWIKVQVNLFIAILPITLWFFLKISWLSLFANAIAIPWVGFCILPFTLLSTIIILINPLLGSKLFMMSAFLLQPLLMYLKWLASLHIATTLYAFPNIEMLLASLSTVVILLMPKGLPGRWLSIVCIFAVVYYRCNTPTQQAVWLTLLDVGQGLSAVIQTQNHLLLYDAGPRYFHGFDSGLSIVIPYLLQLQKKSFDCVIISHGDNDHIGGVWSILNLKKVSEIITSVPERFSGAVIPIHQCNEGQSWLWDGVQFTLLSPAVGQSYSGNNSSCVLQIKTPKQTILLTGDIEKKTEEYLLKNEIKNLPADVLIVPHHGSATSSSRAFVYAVHPSYALFPVGYHNRYRFPAESVLKRYLQIGAQILTTAKNGAIFVRLSNNAGVTWATMSQNYRFWQKPY